MHTVIIMNRHSSELLKDFKFLFKPFVDSKDISFCDWNEHGTDVKTSVPDLYKLIRGKQEWRALILNTDSAAETPCNPVSAENNPFDFQVDTTKDIFPQESDIPLVRLTHILCGYPISTVKNFEKGFEYFDEEQGKTCRIRESEISDEVKKALSEKHGYGLKSIYMEEKVPEGLKEAQDEISRQYTFADIRPREVFLVSTCKHTNEEEHIYASWKTPFEMASSGFSARNNYPSLCRFLSYSLTNAESSRYLKELWEFWLSVLTLSISKIPASTLQAYRLYRIGVDISKEELGAVLNKHMNQVESAYRFVQERMRVKPDYSFEPEDTLVETQTIPVYYEGTSGKDLYIDTNRIGLTRNCPEDEFMFWNNEISLKQREIDKFLKGPRRAIDKASQFLKDQVDSFWGDEYELDRFQVIDLQEEMNRLEAEILTCDTHSVINKDKIKENVRTVDREVRKEISHRMRKKTAILMGILAIASYALGFIPYIINSFQLGSEEFMSAFVLTVVAIVLVSVGGIVALSVLRKDFVKTMQQYNTIIKKMIVDVDTSARKFEKYFGLICSYMKAQSIFSGVRLNTESLSSEKMMLRAHKNALKVSMERDADLLVAYDIRREAEVEKNITSFFDSEKLPRDNKLYYLEYNNAAQMIPLNTSGETVREPYKFIEKLKIERVDIFDTMTGEVDA